MACRAHLIGSDTYTKTVFVKDEVEVAVVKGCRLIGVNLNGVRVKDSLCPAFFAESVHSLFRSHLVAEALTWQRQGNFPWYYFFDEVYHGLDINWWARRLFFSHHPTHSPTGTSHRGRGESA